MGRISDEDIQKVREATDLVALIGESIPLKQKGREFWCCCPFHQEKTPSCKIDPATQLWHCFGCGEGGDVFGFLMKSQDISFPDAVRTLAERAHIDIAEAGGPGVSQSQKARLRDVCRCAMEFYHTQLMRGKSPEADAARAYLASRDLGGEVPKRWSLGFAPGHRMLVNHLASQGFKPQEMIQANVAVQRSGGSLADRFFNRVMFPIFDIQGECIAFGGRVIGQGEPKYLNSQETPLFHKSNVLYGLDKAKAAMTSTGDAIVVEGYTDVIALHEHGITNAVATLGTALTLQHIRLLSRHASKRIIYLFDGDAAGQRAADRALGFINDDMTPEAGKTRIELCAITLPDDLDPADFIEARGADALKALLDQAKPLVLYGIERRLANHDLSSVEGRTRAFADALSVLAPIKTSLLAKDYAVQLAGRLQMREEDALAALAELKPPVTYGAEGQNTPVQEPSHRPSLSEAEKSRRRLERRFLALAVQDPTLALGFADTLAQTHWHDALSASIAAALLSALEDNPSRTPAELVSSIATAEPQAAGVLTGFAPASQGTPQETLAFIQEELQIGDLEESIAALNATLKSQSGASDEEQDMVFHALVDMQKTLAAKKAAHKLSL